MIPFICDKNILDYIFFNSFFQNLILSSILPSTSGIATQLKCTLYTLFSSNKLIITKYVSVLIVLVFVLFTKFVPNSTFRRCSSGINLFNYETKFAPNIMQKRAVYAPLQKIGANKVLKRCFRMHKYLVGVCLASSLR